MIELRGKSVFLRALEREDCCRLWTEAEATEPLPAQATTPGLSVEGADKWFEEIQAKQGREQVYSGIFTLEGELLGDIQLANIDWRNRTATLGIGISCAADRGKGFATEAVFTLLRFAFQELDLFRVSADTAEYNTAARRVLEKCGFTQEGCARQAIHARGSRHNSRTYGLLCTEFDGNQYPTTEST
jgi:RimJ/RimL family protein N-acetyltransferase